MENYILIIYLINFLLIFLMITFEQKNSEVITLWSVVMIIFPIIGFFIYYIFGSTYKHELLNRKKTYIAIEDKYKEIINDIKKSVEVSGVYEKRLDIINVAKGATLGVYNDENEIEIYATAEDKFKYLKNDILRAKESIYIEYYIFNSRDEIGKEIISLLEQKAKEGLDIRVIYDKIGSIKTRYKDFKPLIHNGAKVARYTPSIFGNILLINYRMHRKIVVIDNKVAHTGGMNVADECFSKDEKTSPWRDTDIRVGGNSVKLLITQFLLDWEFVSKKEYKNELENIENDLKNVLETNIKKGKKETNGTIETDEATSGSNKISNLSLQVIGSGVDNDIKDIRNVFIQAVKSTKRQLWIQTPYLILDGAFLDLLKTAKLSGVNIKIIIPGSPDKKFVYAITESYAEELEKCGIEIYKYNGFIHSKILIIDEDVTVIGTANIDHISLSTNYELILTIYGNKFNLLNKQLFLKDIENSNRFIHLKGGKTSKKGSSIFQRIKNTFLRLFSPIV